MTQLIDERFPRSNRYHPDWIIARASGGANALWLTEWLSEGLGMLARSRRGTRGRETARVAPGRLRDAV